ncbi:hypothetical protein SEPCBS119000_002952 [Sporothrix epigloea]|uniref:Uncharacterized protein n=1 Tax=Sporothrix epigloea TaxID=1892477 RepID=A0ABP0DKN9_9PEZI
MGGLVKVVGAGIILASEAIQHARAKSKAAKEMQDIQDRQSGDTTLLYHGASQSHSRSVVLPDGPLVMQQDGSSTTCPERDDRIDHVNIAGPSNTSPPPLYLTPEEEEQQLAERNKQALAAETAGDARYYNDEAVQELDEVADYTDPPSYEEAANETAREEALLSTAVTTDAHEPGMTRYADHDAAGSGSLITSLIDGYIAANARRGGRGYRFCEQALGSTHSPGNNQSFEYNRRRRRQGPISAGIGLIATGVNMYMQSREKRQVANISSTTGGLSNDRQMPATNFLAPAPYAS